MKYSNFAFDSLALLHYLIYAQKQAVLSSSWIILLCHLIFVRQNCTMAGDVWQSFHRARPER